MWGINSPRVMIALIGTVMKESGSFYPIRESWWVYDVDPAAAYRYYANTSLHAAYQGGPDWHGRGYIQATHRPTYEAFNNAMIERYGVDTGVVQTPDRMLRAGISAHFAAWFFIQKGLHTAAEREDWATVRRGVYGANDTDGVNKIRHAYNTLMPLASARGY